MSPLALCALLALLPAAAAQDGAGAQPAAAVQEPGGVQDPVADEGPDRRVQLDFRHAFTVDELDASLAALAAAYPEYLRLESYGRSAGGNELWVLSLTRLADGDPDLKPGLLLVGGLGTEGLRGTELTLLAVLELVENHRRDPRVAALLERAAIYVVPSAHPDLRAALLGADASRGALEPRPSIDGNFEIGWSPGRPGAGPYPLSEPETHALARFLLEHGNIAAVQLLGAGAARGAPVGIPEPEPADRGVHERLARESDAGAGPPLVGLPDLALSGGTLLEFAYGHRGAFGFLTLVGGAGGERSLDPDELGGLGRRALEAALELAEGLPRLALTVRSTQRITRELWQLDLSLENLGLLPTQSRLGARRFAVGPPRLEVSGAATLVAAAAGPPGSPAPGAGYEVVPTRGQGCAVGELDGGAAVDLRLIVRGAEGAALVVEARAPRAGVARLELGLP